MWSNPAHFRSRFRSKFYFRKFLLHQNLRPEKSFFTVALWSYQRKTAFWQKPAKELRNCWLHSLWCMTVNFRLDLYFRISKRISRCFCILIYCKKWLGEIHMHWMNMLWNEKCYPHNFHPPPAKVLVTIEYDYVYTIQEFTFSFIWHEKNNCLCNIIILIDHIKISNSLDITRKSIFNPG